MRTKKGLYIFSAILAILVGLYPLIFVFLRMDFGLLNSKTEELLSNVFWQIGFYTHIILGGIALLIGWVQFSKKLRAKNIQLHKNIGKVYVFSVLLSALAGIYIGMFATGGLVASSGFITLGLIWFYTTLKAFIYAKEKRIAEHQKMMIYSYAVCFAAVTLRIDLPLLILLFKEFEIAYQIVAWLCWVPNLLIAHFFLIDQKS